MADKENQNEALHPKDNEELKKILDSIEEIGGPEKGTTKFGDWSLDGKVSDF